MFGSKANILCLGILVLLIVACGKVATTVIAPKPTTPSPTVAPPAQPSAQEPAVKEVNYESIFKLQYCNYTIANLDYDVSRAKDQQSEAEQGLAKSQSSLSSATDDGSKSALQKNIAEYQITISDMQKEQTNNQAALADTISKCNTLEKKKDSTICMQFIADVNQQLSDDKANLGKEQSNLAQIQSVAKTLPTMANYTQAKASSVQDKITRDQRNVDKAQAIVNKMQSISDELQKRCS